MDVGFDNTCTVSGRWNVFRVIPRLYGWVYKTLRLSPYVVKYNIVVMNVSLDPMGNRQFLFSFYEIFVQNQWGMTFWDQIEDSNTSVMSSVTVRMEYLLAFQYWYCGKPMRGRQKTFCWFLFFGGAWIVGG